MYKVIYDIIYSFHMHLFMVASGFLFYKAYYDGHKINKMKIKKHWINLLVIYILISIIVWGTKYCFNSDVLHPVSVSSVLMIWLNPIGHLWYLHLLLVMYVVNSYLIKLLKTDYINITLLVMLIANIISEYLVFNNVSLLCRFFRFELFFFIGMLWCCKKDQWLFSDRSIIAMLLISVICAIIYFPKMIPNVPIHLFRSLISIGISLSIYSFFRKWCNKDIKLLSGLGKNCLEIYLLHQFPVTLFQLLIVRIIHIDGIINLFVNFVLSICSVLAVIYVMKRINIYDLFFRPYYLLHLGDIRTKMLSMCTEHKADDPRAGYHDQYD